MPVLDLDYVEDSGCDTDMNIVMTGQRRLRRSSGNRGGRTVYGAADAGDAQLASDGIRSLVAAQKHALEL